ncbi:nucleosome assembly protein 1-like 1-B [Oppia nitens]|uniref:nucleosome assembly protein 1-like 1-B n=1 Tax=Oppia nitens TaxID=1686743 RepID=UPI0023D9AD91|nr:nucleosome assembly protein 1-like 1-B [Oppia nitens]
MTSTSGELVMPSIPTNDWQLLLSRQIKALKKLQFEKLKIDGLVAEEIFNVVAKHENNYNSIYEKRRAIISGEIEPTDTDCKLDDDIEDKDEELGYILVNQSKPTNGSLIKGIPGFWLKTMKEVMDLNKWIEKKDEPVLEYLSDIRINYGQNQQKIELKFSFATNEFFRNTSLTKTYEIMFGPNPNNPWFLNDYYPIASKGCVIDWKKGKDVTKLNNTTDGKSYEKNKDSFFDLFNDSLLGRKTDPKKSDNYNNEIQDFLWDDWNLSQLLIKKLVPNAILYFTGDIIESESESSDSEDSSDSESESASD